MSSGEIESIQAELRAFAVERDWLGFHTPRNLVLALVGEVGELSAEFQWLTDDEAAGLQAEPRQHVEGELADVFIYLLRLADVLGIDLGRAAQAKIALNRGRFPISRPDAGE